MDIFKANVRLAWKARKDREDPERPEEFTREELAKDEVAAIVSKLRLSLFGHAGDDPERCADITEVVKEEPFPLKGWDCVSFPMSGQIIYVSNGKPAFGLPSEKDLSKFCVEGRRWFGIEIEYPTLDPPYKFAEAFAPDGEILFQESYTNEPPSFYTEVEEYYPVYRLKLAAATGE